MAIISVKEGFGPQSPRIMRGTLPPFHLYFLNYCLPELCLSALLKTLAAALVLVILASVTSIRSQTISARISVISTSPARVRVEAQLPAATGTLSFRNSYAGIIGLSERIESVQGVGAGGETTTIEKLAPGEFRASQKLSRVSYEVNLAQPIRPSQMSHVSWMNAEQGLFMLSDLLPERIDSGRFSAVIHIDVPVGWTVTSNAMVDGSRFSTDDPDSVVFLVGSALAQQREQLDGALFSVVMSGRWPISNSDLIRSSKEILRHYSRVTRFALRKNVVLMLVPYAGEVGPENWTAETRGNVVVLLMGQNGSRKKILSRIGVVLSHEVFHLWVPNSLELTGDYDWFFEGFTLYEALRTDLRLGFISFDEYLNTIARVYDSYISSADSRNFSLIEASERRWTTQSSLVYEQGMLVAFIYDLSLRKMTDCKLSLDDIYAELFRVAPRGQTNANETIIRVLTGHEGLESFARDYVETTTTINLNPILANYGLILKPGTSETGAKITKLDSKFNKSQSKFLGCLSHNN